MQNKEGEAYIIVGRLILDAEQRGRRHALEQAAAIMCAGCRDQWPIADGAPGGVICHDSKGIYVRCQALPIRSLIDQEARHAE